MEYIWQIIVVFLLSVYTLLLLSCYYVEYVRVKTEINFAVKFINIMKYIVGADVYGVRRPDTITDLNCEWDMFYDWSAEKIAYGYILSFLSSFVILGIISFPFLSLTMVCTMVFLFSLHKLLLLKIKNKNRKTTKHDMITKKELDEIIINNSRGYDDPRTPDGVFSDGGVPK